MRAQRRHELHRNELYAELARLVEFVKKWRTYIVWGLALGVLAVLAGVYMVRSAERKRLSLADTYDRLSFDATTTPDAFLDGMKTLADSADRRLAAMAAFQIGDYYYWGSIAAGGMSGDPRRKELADQAAAYFRRTIRDFPDQPLPVAQAHIGLAKLAESEGDFAAAAKEYQAVTTMKDLAGYPIVADARQGLGELDGIKGPVRMATTTSAPAGAAPGTSAAAPGGTQAAEQQPSPTAGD